MTIKFLQNIPVSMRRITLAAGALLLTVCVAKAPVKASEIPTANVPTSHSTAPIAPEYRLKMHHLHTGENIDIVYRIGNQYIPSAVAQLNHFLRDHRTQTTADYDVREFDLLHSLMAKLGKPNGEIDIVCGYRTPQSNNFLRTRSASTGVAEHSQHMLSKAIDIRVPGVSTIALRDAALSLGMGGVGYYPVSQFVHVDVGRVRQWNYGVASTSHRSSRKA